MNTASSGRRPWLRRVRAAAAGLLLCPAPWGAAAQWDEERQRLPAETLAAVDCGAARSGQPLQYRNARFGFTMTYPKGNAEGYLYEPWHWCWKKIGDSEQGGALADWAPFVNPLSILDGTREWLFGGVSPNSPVRAADVPGPMYAVATLILLGVSWAVLAVRYRRIAT